MKIYFVTHNPNKVKEFNEILSGVCVVEQLEEEYDEIQSDDPEHVVKESVKKLCEKYQKAVVAEDAGLFIDSLKGFPGVHSSPIHKQIGLQGILKLMEGLEDRGCEYRSAVGYCEPGKEPLSFLGIEKGSISESIKGEKGFGHDPIFIPEGESKTYGELGSSTKKFRRHAVEKLMEYLKGET